MSRWDVVTMVAAVLPALAAVLLAFDHVYAALVLLFAGFLLSIAAVRAKRRNRIAAWTAFAANAVLLLLLGAVALLLMNDSS